jgi:hypothetical protein
VRSGSERVKGSRPIRLEPQPVTGYRLPWLRSLTVFLSHSTRMPG